MKITNFKYFLIGFVIGLACVAVFWSPLIRTAKWIKDVNVRETVKQAFRQGLSKVGDLTSKKIVEDFSRPITARAGRSFGKEKQLTFELFRNGTFFIDGKSGYAWQRSDSYRDSAFIRSTEPLPETYTVSVVVGDFDYGLDKIEGMPDDPEYPEGPRNENGCYLLAITDTKPEGHHMNIWWHQHRKAVIDIDNNVWGQGMPDPIFMVYFDTNNKLRAYDGAGDSWSKEWAKGISYRPGKWYRVEIQKTKKEYLFRVKTEDGKILKRASVDRENVWHAQGYPEYFVIGDPHENYYQGSMKIREISIRY